MHIDRSTIAMGWKRYGFTVFSLILWGGLSCGEAKPKPECKESEHIFTNFAASPDVNRDADGNPRSTYLRVFQLRSASMVGQASFDAIWSEPGSLFADSLLDGPRELIIKPGERISRRLVRHPEAYLILIVGNFRQTQGTNRWRSQINLPAHGEQCAKVAQGEQPPALTIDVLLDGYQIFTKTNFQATSYFESPPNTVSNRIEADPDWRDPGSQPGSPGPVAAPQPPHSRPATRMTQQQEVRQPEPSAQRSKSQIEEESSPARNPRLRRRKKKITPPSTQKQNQEPEVPLL